MSRITKFIVYLIGAGIILGVIYVFFLYKDYLIDNREVYQYDYPKQSLKDKVIKNQEWFNSFSEKNDFTYPATETSFSLNFLTTPIATQRFLIEDLDSYIFFCLKEVFKEEKIDFATSKTTQKLDIVLYLPDKKSQQILKMLDYYGIKYKNN